MPKEQFPLIYSQWAIKNRSSDCLLPMVFWPKFCIRKYRHGNHPCHAPHFTFDWGNWISEHWEKGHKKTCSQHREDGGNRKLWSINDLNKYKKESKNVLFYRSQDLYFLWSISSMYRVLYKDISPFLGFDLTIAALLGLGPFIKVSVCSPAPPSMLSSDLRRRPEEGVHDSSTRQSQFGHWLDIVLSF